MSDLVRLTVDGKAVAVPKGTLLVEACKQVAVDVPVFCYHHKLKPVGACRMCLVEIEKMPRLQTACTTPVAEGMVVKTTSPGAVDGQQSVLELLLANHPLDCPVCDKGGECPLQDNTFRYGKGVSRASEPKRAKQKALPLSELIVLDRERCILCYRCTRFQEEIVGDGALVPLERGGRSEIGTLDGEAFDSPFSGNTVELCPVGALTSRQYRFRSRPWDLQHTPSVCSGCSVGCNVTIDSRDGALLRVLSRENPAIDDGWLCDQGRYATLPPVTAKAHGGGGPGPKRPLRPLVRDGGTLVPATWDAALSRARQLLGGGRAAVVLSTALTNEALAAAAAVLPGALPGASLGFGEPVVSPWPVVGRIANLPGCRKVVDLGCDPWQTLPVLALRVRKALTNGGALVVAGPSNGLFRDTRHWLKAADAAALLRVAEDLASALAGRTASQAAIDAAATLRGDGPAAVLLGTAFAIAEPKLAKVAAEIARLLGANAETGLTGAPLRGANARGAAAAAPGFVSVDPLAGRPDVVFSLGGTPVLPAFARAIVATSGALPDDPSLEVVLPMAHPYETDGHLTNLDGTTQRLRAAGRPGREVRSDLEIVRALAGVPDAAAGGRR